MRVFIGGATGAVGRALVQRGVAAGLDVVPHVRPRSVSKHTAPPEPAVFELSDPDALDRALDGCTAIVSSIGSMRRRFKQGDTYQSSDINAQEALAEAAERVGIPRIVLVSAWGVEWVPGSYYQAKRSAEAAFREAGPAWTIVRPSALNGSGRRAPPGGSAMDALGRLPGLRGVMDDSRPIPVEVVAEAVVQVLLRGVCLDSVLTGRHLWRLGAAAAGEPAT